jgi:hypothetical protein
MIALSQQLTVDNLSFAFLTTFGTAATQSA